LEFVTGASISCNYNSFNQGFRDDFRLVRIMIALHASAGSAPYSSVEDILGIICKDLFIPV